MEIVSLEPLMVKIKDSYGNTLTTVLNPVFDEELISYIKEHNLKIGDII